MADNFDFDKIASEVEQETKTVQQVENNNSTNTINNDKKGGLFSGWTKGKLAIIIILLVVLIGMIIFGVVSGSM